MSVCFEEKLILIDIKLNFSRKMRLKLIILMFSVSDFLSLGTGVPLDESKKLVS